MKEMEATQAPSVSHWKPVFSHWGVVQLHHRAAEMEETEKSARFENMHVQAVSFSFNDTELMYTHH